MAYKVIILYRLYMPSYFLGTFTEYPYIKITKVRKAFFPEIVLLMTGLMFVFLVFKNRLTCYG